MTTTFDPEIGKSTQWQKGQPSPNPGGRPKSRLLSVALRDKLAETKADDAEGRTYAEVIAANLIEIASSQHRSAVAAAAEIADRIEGRVTQEVEVNDIVTDLRSRPTEHLRYYLEHGCWPEGDELFSAENEHAM